MRKKNCYFSIYFFSVKHPLIFCWKIDTTMSIHDQTFFYKVNFFHYSTLRQQNLLQPEPHPLVHYVTVAKVPPPKISQAIKRAHSNSIDGLLIQYSRHSQQARTPLYISSLATARRHCSLAPVRAVSSTRRSLEDGGASELYCCCRSRRYMVYRARDAFRDLHMISLLLSGFVMRVRNCNLRANCEPGTLNSFVIGLRKSKHRIHYVYSA